MDDLCQEPNTIDFYDQGGVSIARCRRVPKIPRLKTPIRVREK